MDLVGKEVIHKAFGEGKIIEDIENYLIIEFEVGNKEFVFPDAFKTFLKFKDDEDTKELLPDIKEQFQEEQQEKKEIKQFFEKKRTLNLKQYDQAVAIKQNKAKSKSKPKRVNQNSSNLAFKCNLCNGGQTADNIGFNGVCSDEMIEANIKVEKNAWCKADESPCSKYHNNEITREELDQQFTDDQFVCYESRMLGEWRAGAGFVLNGKNKGKPKKLARVRKDSLCILTTRDPQDAEEDRYVFAVFLIDEFSEGTDTEEGYVKSNSKYKLALSKEEAKNVMYWNYYSNANNPKNISWNSGMHRYVHDDQATQVLRDIVNIKKDTEDEELAKEFLDHYCKINNINLEKIGELNGALIQQDDKKDEEEKNANS